MLLVRTKLVFCRTSCPFVHFFSLHVLAVVTVDGDVAIACSSRCTGELLRGRQACGCSGDWLAQTTLWGKQQGLCSRGRTADQFLPSAKYRHQLILSVHCKLTMIAHNLLNTKRHRNEQESLGNPVERRCKYRTRCEQLQIFHCR